MKIQPKWEWNHWEGGDGAGLVQGLVGEEKGVEPLGGWGWCRAGAGSGGGVKGVGM